MLLAGDIDMGHARALLAIDAASQILLANEIIAKRLSVRDAEKLVGRHLRESDETQTRSPRGAKEPSGDVKRLQEALSDHLGRSEEHTSELQSLMRNSYAVICLKK